MATATLLDVATPEPALTLTLGSTATASSTVEFCGTATTMTTANTGYNLNSVSLTAGTWAVIGICGTTASGTTTPYLCSTSGTKSNSWTVLTSGTGTEPASVTIAAVIKLTTTTTVYLNGSCGTASRTGYGILRAVQFQ
jgi:hypothetical protein